MFCGWLSVKMNADESRGSMEWKEFNVLVNVDKWNQVSANWNVCPWLCPSTSVYG